MATDKKVKLSTAGSLHAFLSHVMDEGVKSALAQKALTEKEKQAALAPNLDEDEDSSGGGVDDLFAGGDDSDDSGDGESSGHQTNDGQAKHTSKTMDDETEKLKKGEIKARDVISKLNDIRAGKSFRDEKVGHAMEEYISSLSRPEKVALMAFLKGIGQIVTGEVPGQAAEDPSDSPSDVKMEKGDEESVRHVRPNVIKGGGKPGPSGGTRGAEDTSSPAPITPKKR